MLSRDGNADLSDWRSPGNSGGWDTVGGVQLSLRW